jgi:hypothetical protein
MAGLWLMMVVAAGALGGTAFAAPPPADDAGDTRVSTDSLAGYGPTLAGPSLRHARSAAIKLLAVALPASPPQPPPVARRFEPSCGGPIVSAPSANPRASRAPPRA